MKLLAAAWLLLSLLIAQISAEISPIRILYRWSFEADYHGIAAFNVNDELIGYACASTLDTGYFQDESISFAVSREPPMIGTIKVGTTVHEITFRPPGRDDPSCSKIYNNDMVEFDCMAVLHSPMPAAIHPLENTNCFGNRYAQHDLMAGEKMFDPSRSVPAGSAFQGLKLVQDHDLDLSHRADVDRPENTTDHSVCLKNIDTRVWGDGDPHQCALHQQVTVGTPP